MEHWHLSFSTLDRIFLLAGILGAIVVVCRVVLLLAGGDAHGVPDGDLDVDAGDGFHLLSVHGLASFFMMFGFVGLALSRQSQARPGWSILGGTLAGAAAIWVIAHLFRFALGLQSSGNVSPQAAAGCVGTVYLTIPAGGTGRVNVRIGQRVREMDAMDAEGGELPTGTSVRVVRVERSLAIVKTLSAPEVPCSSN
jgi:membrane protein implicated in regulation of membrane protease activity